MILHSDLFVRVIALLSLYQSSYVM